MKGTMRRAVSIVLALAMVITSLSYTPKTVEAAEDYSGLSFTEVVGMNGSYAWNLKENNIAGFSGTPGFYGQNYMKIVYSADNKTEDTKITVDGVPKTLSDEEVFEQALGMTTFLVSALSDNNYHELVITTTTGKAVIILKKGTPSGSGELDTTSGTSETTTATQSGGDYSDLNFETIENTTNPNNGIEHAVAWIQPAEGVRFSLKRYGTVGAGNRVFLEFDYAPVYKDVKVNGVALPTDNDHNAGGAWLGFFDSDLTDNAYNVVTGTNGNGQEFSFVIRKGTPSEQSTTGGTLTDLTAVTNAFVYNFTEAGEGYKVYFKDGNVLPEGSTRKYIVSIGEQTVEVAESGASVNVDGLGLTDGTKYDVKVKAVYTDGEGTEIVSPDSEVTQFTYKASAVNAYDDGIAQIFINTSRTTSGTKITQDVDIYKDESKIKFDAAITVKGADGTVAAWDYGTANVRGNSTKSAQKKAYNIKFNAAHDLFGMGSAKKWSLLANCFDKTLMRNQVAFDFYNKLEAQHASGNAFSSKCKPADLYVDGNYLGSYLLIESVEEGVNRVNINAGNANNDDILLEIDNSGRDESTDPHLKGRTSKYDMYFAVNEPEDIATDPQYDGKRDRTLAYLEEFETALQAKNFTQISNLIDLESFVDFYIVSELFKTKDIGFSSTRYYIQSQTDAEGNVTAKKLYAGPLWDLDLSSGNALDNEKYDDLYAQTENKWFGALMAVPEFAELVKTRWEELLPTIKDLYAAEGAVTRTYNELKKSADNNYSKAYNVFSSAENGYNNGWVINAVYGASQVLGQNVYGSMVTHNTYEEYVDDFRTWLSNRTTYLTQAFGARDVEEVLENLEEQAKSPVYNLAYQKTVTITGGFNEGVVESLTDGDFNTKVNVTDGTGGNGSQGAASFIVDLGTYYPANSIDKIIIRYQDERDVVSVAGHSYSIQYLVHGNFFRDAVPEKKVASLSAETPQTVDNVSHMEGNVRYIRVNYPTTATYGMQIREIVVLDSDKNAVEVEPIMLESPNFTATTDGFNKIQVTIDSVETQSDYEYYVIIDGKTVDKVSAGTHVFENIDGGTHKVDVVSYRKGSTSNQNETQEIEVDVKSFMEYTAGTRDIAFEAQKEINGALNYDYTDYDGVTASASSNEGAVNSAFDNNVGTGWQAANDDKDNQFIVINLGAVRNINQIEAIWENASAKDYTIEISSDGTNYEQVAAINNAAAGNNRHDTISFAESITGQYVKVRATARTMEEWGVNLKEIVVYGPNTEDEEVTTSSTIKPVADPADAVWKEIPNSNGEYWYYIPAEYTSNYGVVQIETDGKGKNIYIAVGGVAAPYSAVKINGIDMPIPEGAFARIYLSDLPENGAYNLYIKGQLGRETNMWVKKMTKMNYKPTGLAVTQSGTNAVINWNAPADAGNEGYEGVGYSVKVGDTTITGPLVDTTYTFDMGELPYGSYEVTVNTVDKDGKVLDSANTTLQYKDPEAVSSTLQIKYQWEGLRREVLSWDKVENATGYAVYADGKLFETTTDLSINVRAFAYASNENENAQLTTVGQHTTKVVALFNNAEASAFDEINPKHVIGEDSFNLDVNYIFGRFTDTWNKNKELSLWAFTICENVCEPVNGTGGIDKGASAKAAFHPDGSASLVINDVGKHRTFQSMDNPGDQAWTIKVGSYNAPAKVGQLTHLSYDISGPASLIGKTIRIKLCPDECDQDGTYLEAEYLNKYYTFEDDGNGGAVIHFSESFESTNDTYDMFFGLGLLQDPNDENKEPIELDFSEADTTDIYGVKSVTASSVYPTPDADGNVDHNKHGIMVSWETDVPYRLRKQYKYEVYIDGVKVSEEDAVTGTTWYGPSGGYAHGDYHVEVRSIYKGTVTGTAQDDVTVFDRTKPDVVISSMVVQNNDSKEYYTGDTVPVDVTIKNISTIDIEVAENQEISVHLYLRKADGTLTAQKAYFIVDPNEEGKKVLKAGQEVTKTMNYIVDPADAGDAWRYTFVATADADQVIDESNEENNTYVRTFVFPEKPDAVEFHNDGKDISITWPGSDYADHYVINYTSNGEAKSIETRNTDTTYVLTDILDNNTTVDVYTVRANGAQVIRATGTALADLELVNVKATEADGVIYADKDNEVAFTVKNVGFAKASGNFPAKVEDGNGWGFTPDGDDSVVNPNEEVVIKSVNGVAAGKYADKVGQLITVWANADDASENEGNGYIAEVDDKGTIDRTRNNFKEFTFAILNGGKLTLNAPTAENDKVTATWTDENVGEGKLIAEGYQLVYISNGETKTVDVTGNEYTFNEPIDNNTEVKIMAKYEGLEDYYRIAGEKALADLVIEKVTIPEKTYLEIAFDAVVQIKNQGTAQVPAASEEFEEGYGGWIIVAINNDNFINEGGNPNNHYISAHTAKGLMAGVSTEITLSGITATAVNAEPGYDVQFKVDAPGFAEAEANGFITESNEDNNTQNVNIKVDEKPYVQNKEMDWTPLYDETDKTKPYEFKVANVTQPAHIEYKVLDTSYTDVDYADIFKQYNGYNTEWFSMGMGALDEEHLMFKETEKGFLTLTEFAQVKAELCENYSEYKGTENDANYVMLSTTKDIVDLEGNVLVAANSGGAAGSRMIYNGQGFNFYANSYATGKYYIYKIKNQENGQFVTVALRVVGENGQWTKVLPTDDTNPDALSFWYHGEHCDLMEEGLKTSEDVKPYLTTGAMYYDGSDLGLATITCYNGGYLTLVPDTTEPLGAQGEWKIQIVRAGVDAEGNFVKPTEEITDENSKVITRVPGQFNIQGDRLLLKLPELMQDLPIHSANGGQKDENYFFMKLYSDTTKRPNEYIEIPIMIRADIPQIEAPQGVIAKIRKNTADESVLTVSWDQTANQTGYDYHYDVQVFDKEDGTLIGEVKDATPKQAHVFDVSKYAIDDTSTVFVKITANWCGQSIAYTEVVENTYEKGWRPIGGDDEIDVHAGRTADTKVTVLGKFSFYDDVQNNHTYTIVGYNGMYMSLTGNPLYIGGDPEDETTQAEVHISKGVTSEAELDTMTDDDYTDETNDVYLYAEGMMQINTQNQFQVTYQTTYYNVKVIKGENVSVIKMKVEVKPGDVEVKAFQMNTDTSEGAVSEFNPSFRAVSRASKVVAVGDPIVVEDENGVTINNYPIASVQSYGTMYTVNEGATTDTMKFGDTYVSNAEIADGVYSYEATKENGTLNNWPQADDANSFYYALTFKGKSYLLDMLDKDYTVRAYAVTEDGDIVYGNKVETTSIYKIAKVLYNGNLMSRKSAHDFLYDNVLNIVDIKNNRAGIANAMFKALNVTKTTDEAYALINNMYKDLYRYITLTGVYKVDRYYKRGAFVCKTMTMGKDTEKALLELLNTVTTDGKEYTTVADWIENETENYDKCKGFYKRVEFFNKTTVIGGEDI